MSGATPAVALAADRLVRLVDNVSLNDGVGRRYKRRGENWSPPDAFGVTAPPPETVVVQPLIRCTVLCLERYAPCRYLPRLATHASCLAAPVCLATLRRTAASGTGAFVHCLLILLEWSVGPEWSYAGVIVNGIFARIYDGYYDEPACCCLAL